MTLADLEDVTQCSGSFAAAVAELRSPPAAAGADDAPLMVLKFGSSVLRSPADLPRVAGEIFRQRRTGARIVAVVSALAGETDRLFAEAALVAGGADCAGVADLVALGEARTAALLRIACDRIGVRATALQPGSVGLRTEGGEVGARAMSLDPAPVLRALERHGVVIVPGFVGTDADGVRTLLARGGSDFSAIYLAGELGADVARLYKDADGVFEADPARVPGARRFDAVSWDDALIVARPLIQPEAVEYARARRLPVEVEAIGSPHATRVGPVTTPPCAVVPPRPVRVALAGCGTVGQAVAARLAGEGRFEIVSVLVRDVAKRRTVASPAPVTSEWAALLAAAPDIVVDALSCERVAAELCETLLARGIHVASAGKRMVEEAGARLGSLAQGGARLLHSAAVGGGVPMLELVGRARAAGIVSIRGVLNGTTNAILTAMARGDDFAGALARTQAAGFAEQDPRADLSGADAAAKLRLLARAAWGATPPFAVESLDAARAAAIAASSERWVQLSELRVAGDAVVGGVSLRRAATLGWGAPPDDEWNRLELRTADGRIWSAEGRGAGGPATAEAIVADLFDLAALPRTIGISLPLAVAC